MTEMKSHLKIALQSISCFANDGKVDSGELNYLLGIAKADGRIDADEARVLTSIMQKSLQAGVDSGTSARINDIMAEIASQAKSWA
ncbi:hypothetical protein [Chitinilyticum litopenaei]|uniref:hypothetical protein n=1 Tax=Chitinilyticum litopenaei TaxID=1121276 RepID=UPI00041FE160|nr:hypothetical protein [Chitinilyticum litopenaei]